MAPREGLLGAEAGARAAAQTPDDEAAERQEQELLRDMMGETEKEIYHEAFGEEPPENDGDTTLEDEAGDDDLEEPEEEELSPEDEVDDEGLEEPAGEPDRGDPRVALRAERARRQELERQLAEAQGFREGVQSVPRQTQQEQPPPRPDMFSDPEGWERQVRAEAASAAAQQVHADRVNAALAETHEQFGDEFQVAFNAFTSQPRNQESSQLARRMVNSPDPGAFLMRWAEPILQDYRAQRQEQELERIGAMLEDDPGLRDAVISRLNGRQPRAAPRGNRQPLAQRSGRRGPPSLNSAGGSGSSRVGADPRGFDGSDQAIFDYAFSDR
jgi:hypothetical protein